MEPPFRSRRLPDGTPAVAQAFEGVPLAAAVDAAQFAFEALYGVAFPKVYAFIRSQVATADTAQELVSRIFLKAYRHRTSAPTDAAAIQWIFRIAHTTLIDYWRVDRKRERASVPIEELEDLADSSNAESAYERKERSAHLLRLIGELSEDDRTVLALKFTAQRTNRDIATILGVSEGAVSMRLLRALRRLRERLQTTGWRP